VRPISVPFVRSLGSLAAAALTAACVAASPAARAAVNARVFDRVWSLVDSRYYDPRAQGVDWAAAHAAFRPRALAAPDENALYAVLTTMLQPLNDDHAYVQSPAEVRREALGESARPLLGVRIVRRGTGYAVDDVRPGSPADAAGVETGWIVESADGRPYDVGVVRVDGVPVSLVFRDVGGATRTLTIAPRTASPGPERYPVRRVGDAYVLAFDNFDPGAADWLYEQLRAVPDGAPLVVDLRGNGGGRVVEVERALGCFLPRGARVAEMRTRRGRPRVSTVLGACPAGVDGPVAVLVGRRSRSGAEMFAAALQEAGRATVVGGRTAGALLSSLQYPLPDGGRLTLSEADFVTARGNRIERFGLPPDLAVEVTQADRRAGRDPALDAAVALVARQAAARPLRSAGPETPE